MGFAGLSSASADRIRMALTGAGAGLTFWVLADVLPDMIQNDRAVLFLAALLGAFFAAVLAASGPLNTARAIVVGLAVSALPALLLLWASFRFDNVKDFLETGHPLFAFALLASLPVPFLIAGLGPERNWRDYPELFNQSWNVVVRYVAAWLFTGLFWAVMMLSNELFGIIGLEIIEDMLDIEPVPYVITGLVLGLALAVVNELSDYVSPFLVLRLLRLLLPLVLLVVLVFVVMVPIRGLSGLFGSLSAATILMAMAIGGITLVSTAIDQSDDEAVTMPFMRLATRVLALALPVLAGLAAYAVWMRVNQHGWSPDRLGAATLAAAILAYAILYMVAVARSPRWMKDIRRFNIWMAMAVIAVAALWLTPVVNPQRLSANSQLARYQSGQTAVEDLDLWTITRDWGRAGQSVAPEFAKIGGPGAAAVAEQLAALDTANDFHSYQRLLSGPQSDRMQDFLSRVVVRPAGAVLPEDLFGDAGRPDIWLDACARTTVADNPGCAMVLADFLPEAAGTEILLATKEAGDWLRLEMWSREDSGQWRNHGTPVRLSGPEAILQSDAIIDQIATGEFALGPVSVTTIGIGESRFIMLP